MERKPSQVITGLVRFSYLNVFTPKVAPGSSKPKYGVSLLIRKDDKETLGKIKSAMAHVAKESASILGKNYKKPVRDGDAERPDDPAYKGCYFINCSSDTQPGIVDKSRQPIMNHEELVSGDYGRCDINFYAFNVGTNKGIAVGLNNVQKLKDGKPLGIVRDPEDAFAEEFEIEEDDFDLNLDNDDIAF